MRREGVVKVREGDGSERELREGVGIVGEQMVVCDDSST
jgi:hypothetical protein